MSSCSQKPLMRSAGLGLILALSTAQAQAKHPAPAPSADELLAAVGAQLAPLRRLEVQITVSESGRIVQECRFRTDLDLQRVSLRSVVPSRVESFYDRVTDFFQVRLSRGRTLTGLPVPAGVMRSYALMPEPSMVFSRSPGGGWKVRRVDVSSSDPGAGRWLVVLSNEIGAAHSAREEWLIQQSPGLLLSVRAFGQGRGKGPESTVTVDWQPVGGLFLPRRVVRTQRTGSGTRSTWTLWSETAANPTFAADWFPEQP